MGYIDCTEDCPGTEEEFKHFREILEGPEMKKYPKIAAMASGNKGGDKSDAKDAKDTKDEAPKEDKPDTKKMFLASLTKCTSFSEETLALLKLADSGLKFGAVSSDPNDLTYVAPGALSNISQVEYDYSDYYDDLEETSKKRRDVGVQLNLSFYFEQFNFCLMQDVPKVSLQPIQITLGWGYFLGHTLVVLNDFLFQG